MATQQKAIVHALTRILGATAVVAVACVAIVGAQQWDRFNNLMRTSGSAIVDEFFAVGNRASIVNDDDTITINASRTDTATPVKHAIGYSATLITPWTSNPGSKNLVVYDSLGVPSPRTGVTIPESIVLSANHWIGADASSAGTIAQLIGLNINNSVNIAGTTAVTDQWGIVIKDMQAIAGGSAPSRSAAILIDPGDAIAWCVDSLSGGCAQVGGGISGNSVGRVEIAGIYLQSVAFHSASGNIATNNVLAINTITLDLPAATTAQGAIIRVKNIGAGTITIASDGGLITGTTTIAAGVVRQYISNGADWFEF